MCHVSRLTIANQRRLRQMPLEYHNQLEKALEGGNVRSTRTAVTPIFERVYAAWQEREVAVIEARAAAISPEAVLR